MEQGDCSLHVPRKRREGYQPVNKWQGLTGQKVIQFNIKLNEKHAILLKKKMEFMFRVRLKKQGKHFTLRYDQSIYVVYLN